MKDLLERTIAEIDRQMKAEANPTDAQALIWIFASQQAREALIRLYGRKDAANANSISDYDRIAASQ